MVSMLGTLALSAGAWAQDHSMMDMMGSNGDGVVSAREHATAATAMFKKMDANSDGTVTVAEMDAAHDQRQDEARPWRA